jgi:hypothetical protein
MDALPLQVRRNPVARFLYEIDVHSCMHLIWPCVCSLMCICMYTICVWVKGMGLGSYVSLSVPMHVSEHAA